MNKTVKLLLIKIKKYYLYFISFYICSRYIRSILAFNFNFIWYRLDQYYLREMSYEECP